MTLLHNIPKEEQLLNLSEDLKRAIIRIYEQYVIVNRTANRVFETRLRVRKSGALIFEYHSDIESNWSEIIAKSWQGLNEPIERFKMNMLTQGIVYD